jgi:Skp family chaperone for outer membrane proteins
MKTFATVACIFLGLAICAIAENSIANNAEVNANKVKHQN